MRELLVILFARLTNKFVKGGLVLVKITNNVEQVRSQHVLKTLLKVAI